MVHEDQTESERQASDGVSSLFYFPFSFTHVSHDIPRGEWKSFMDGASFFPSYCITITRLTWMEVCKNSLHKTNERDFTDTPFLSLMPSNSRYPLAGGFCS